MPNLVGIWNPALDEEAIRKALARQLHRVRVPGVRYDEYICAHPGFGAALMDHGISENGVQPVVTEDGRFSLLFDGELHNAEDLRIRFRKELPERPLTTPGLCLRLIVRFGEAILPALQGLFCIVLYDRWTRQLKLFSHRYGFRPLYYVVRQGALLFGSELKASCAIDPAPRQIDELATLELFSYGYHLSDRTWMDGYVRLGAATVMTVDEKGVRARKYWEYKYNESAPTLDQPTYFTGFATLLDRAVERCMRGKHRIGMFLSGGYDSRSVAASIRKHHLPIPAFTFGHPESRDVRYAAMLAERLGMEHYPLTDTGPYLYPYCRPIVWRTEGMSSFASCTSMRYHSLFQDKMDIFLTGFLGEFSGSHTWPRLLRAHTRKEAIHANFDRVTEGQLATVGRIFSPAFLERNLEVMRARFEHSFEQIHNDHPLNVSDCWRFTCNQPFSTWQSTSVDRHKFEVRAPHLDFDLVDFLLQIPPHARLEQRVYKKMIAYSYPAIRDVPCTNSGLPINPHFAREYAAMITRYGARKAVAPFRKLFSLKEPLDREFRDLNEDFRAEPELVEHILRPLLRAGIYPATVFNHSGIETIITEHYQKNGRHEAALSRLISWGLAVKYFLHGDLSDVPATMYSP